MEEISAQGTAEITFQKQAVDNLKANKFILFYIIGCARLKKHLRVCLRDR